ncbi:MAG TPA: carbohydrate-binding protein, partial [Planctomycetota bacterium]|nr:carbohydrate-binding protein [Planctomycetota bacterium]
MRTMFLLFVVTLLSTFSVMAADVNLRVVTWNLEGWQQNSTTAVAQAREMFNSGGDVFGFQECEPSLFPIYKSELERLTGQTWYGTSTSTPPILSKYPILETSGKDIGRNSWGANRTATHAKIRVNGVDLNIFNTHLDIGPPPDWGEGYRTENLSILLPWCRSFAGPKLLIGDMNSNWDSYWINEIKKEYTDTWQDVTGSPSSAPVTNEAGWRPDYIFRSKESASSMRPTSSWVIATPWSLSDHRPVVADIAIVGTSTPPPPPPAIALPGRIQAEDYVTYRDTSAGNNGGQYRFDDVDIEGCTDTGGGYNVGWIDATEYLSYNVNVTQAGTYNLVARVASAVAGTKTLHLTVDGVNVTGAMSFTNSSGWQAWVNLTASNIPLSAGTHELRFYADTAAFNLNYIDALFVAAPGVPLPGRIQAEDYKAGGFYDTTSGNSGGQYRNDSVDIEGCSDTGGGYNVGWISAGEWLAYNVNVAQSGTYRLTARVASAVAGTKTMHVSVNGTDVTGAMSFTNSSGWQAWVSLSANVNLSAGSHELRFHADTSGFN